MGGGGSGGHERGVKSQTMEISVEEIIDYGGNVNLPGVLRGRGETRKFPESFIGLIRCPGEQSSANGNVCF